MKPFKKRAELETNRQDLLANVEVIEIGSEITNIAVESTQTLRRLTVDQLVDKWDQLEDDYILLKWKLAMLISDKFKSKIEFGQFLQELRITNPNHALCVITQQTLNRYAHAARFCDRFGIYDLKAIRISPTAIYQLSKPANEAIVDKQFIDKIKKKSLPVAEVERLIYQAHSITGSVVPEPSQTPAKKRIEPPAEKLADIQAVSEDYAQVNAFEQVAEEVDREIEQPEVVAPIDLSSVVVQTMVEIEEDEELKPRAELTDEELATNVMAYLEGYGKPWIKMIPIFQLCIDKAKLRVYGSKK